MEHPRTSCPALAWSALAAVYYLAATLSHELASDVYLGLANRVGMAAALRIQDALALLALPVGAWLALGPGRRSGRVSGREALAWLALAALLAAADRLLIVTAVERVHYPQYALLAILLRRVLADETLVLGLACLAGMADELLQYLARPANTGYLDWNDFCLNLLGAAAGLLLARALGVRALASPRAEARLRAGFLVLCGLLAGAAAVAWADGRLLASAPAREPLSVFARVDGELRFVLSFFSPDGFWSVAPSGRAHHVLTPGEGLASLALLQAGLIRLLAWSKKKKTAGKPAGFPAG
ncbi:MAG: hypothetical protein AB1916_10990 [Thermodesulfobacteriota bacterium]